MSVNMLEKQSSDSGTQLINTSNCEARMLASADKEHNLDKKHDIAKDSIGSAEEAFAQVAITTASGSHESLVSDQSMGTEIYKNQDSTSGKSQIDWNIFHCTDVIADMMFQMGILLCAVVSLKLAWNIIVEVLQSLKIQYWFFGTLVCGVSVLAFYLVSNLTLHYMQEFPILFVWATVLIGATMTVFITGELSNLVYEKVN
ncbi:hypothetical protein FB446DRAFT_785496 [Lentinula raphanica]|nr:hypothetical protein FB446DRAFT_785496 [Lentinula raphanica]